MKTSSRTALCLASLAFGAPAACIPSDDVSIGAFLPLSVAACVAHGGVAMPDPGDGSLFEEGCPEGDALGLLDDPESIEGGLCCPG